MAQAKSTGGRKPAAKKTTAQAKETTPVAETPVMEAPVMEAPTDTWELKDRTYLLIGNKQPVVTTIPVRHTNKRPLLWFDPEKKYERELRYATNQKSCFVDEQQGAVTMEHVIMRNGSITVPARKVALQKLLSLYHPLKGVIFEELNEQKNAVEDIDFMDLQFEAQSIARELEVEEAEAILRVELGNRVDKLDSSSIKRDIRLFARNNPELFLKLANDDNVQLRNTGIKAVAEGILKISGDQRNVLWASSNQKVMTVPFDENPYSALAAFFKTDDGYEILQSIEKRLK